MIDDLKPTLGTYGHPIVKTPMKSENIPTALVKYGENL